MANTKLLTPRDVAKLLQVTPTTVTRWCRQGKIYGAVKLGRVWRINVSKSRLRDMRKVYRERVQSDED